MLQTTAQSKDASNLSPTLLTTDTSLILLVDYQPHVLKGVQSTDHDLIELNAQALARAAKAFRIPVILSTIGVQLRGDHPTFPSIRAELAGQPEYDRNTMNAWEDEAFHEAVLKSGRKRLIFAGLWTEVCLLYPLLHAQRDGFETYFVLDAIGGNTMQTHETAIQRMIQAGSQPVTLTSMLLEIVRDWKTSPHTNAFLDYITWYTPKIEEVSIRIGAHQVPSFA